VIGDALASVVEVVDACLVVDTRAGAPDEAADPTIEAARAAAGDKLVVRRFAWCDDFAAARNFALDAATELGADWSLTVDTDERIDWRGEDVRATLASPPRDIGCWLMLDASGAYAKERIFRLPVRARFRGPTHEAFPAYEVGSAVLERPRFRELLKTPAQVRAKFERDARVLERFSAEHPDDPRWLYYLGDALHGLGRLEEGADAFRRCAALRGWNEEAAWACYRAAECHCALGRWDDAVDACGLGLARHAGIGELAWLAGFASWRKGDAGQAIWWGRIAVSMSVHSGWGARVHRIGFRHVPALYEGPWDVLRYAYRAAGDEVAADQAERMYTEAKAARERAT
jgi:tetratricopeptide (TPR) repeat protein